MKKYGIIFLLAFIVSGCESGIKVLNLQTNQRIFFSGKSGYFDELVPTPLDSQSLYSIFRVGDHLQLDQRDFSGALLKTYQIPLFSEYYGVIPSALSPDETKFAYLNDTTNSLYIYDLVAQTESLLRKRIVWNVFSVKGLLWMDNTDVIVLLSEDFVNGKILRLNVTTKTLVATLELDGEPKDYAFSPAKMLLAVAPMNRGAGIKIIDVREMRVIDKITHSNPCAWLGLSAWNPEGTKLLYIDVNSDLNIYEIPTKITTTIGTIPSGNVPYFLGYPTENICVIRYGSSTVFIDVTTKKTIRTMTGIKGTIIFVDHGNVMAYVKY